MGRSLAVRLLLDTHALLRWWEDDHRIGKLPGIETALRDFKELITADGFSHRAVAHSHAINAGGFDVEHRDPFDWTLAAQAVLEGAVLATEDSTMKLFRVKCFW